MWVRSRHSKSIPNEQIHKNVQKKNYLSKKFVNANIKLMSHFKILTFQICLSIKSLVRKGLRMKEF